MPQLDEWDAPLPMLDDDEEWRQIDLFPGYSVSNYGRVLNNETMKLLRVVKNQNNVKYVGLVLNRQQYSRAVDLLVAEAFLEPHPMEAFNESVIHLDGDLGNCRVDNLMWRPRWFKMAYQKEFRSAVGLHIKHPIYCVDTGEIFDNSRHAACTLGCLERDIVISCSNGPEVWPYGFDFDIWRP